MLAIRNFGQKSLDELTEKLREKGFFDVLEEAEDEESASDDESDEEEPGEVEAAV